MRRASTLIELLIVVAIIAILAAIAVPNFLEAQTRAKVSRTRADMRSVATGIESYRIDANAYPPPFGIAVEGRDSWAVLSTPVAYLTAGRMQDPFARASVSIGQTTLTYEAINGQQQIIETGAVAPASVLPAGQRAYWWWIASRGADARYGFMGGGSDPEYKIRTKFYNSDTDPGGFLTTVYDPTNGTTSLGNIYRAGGEIQGFAGLQMNR
jgi:prepilin-type N-terminal cleavage/methylation domain-containing protein